MAAGTPFSAKNTVVRVAGTVLYQSEWEVDPETDWDPANAADGLGAGGWKVNVACLTGAEVTLAGWWDAGANMHDAPLSITAGNLLANVRLYINGVGSPNWYFPLFEVLGVPMTVRVENKILYRIRGRNHGTFSYPTGNAA